MMSLSSGASGACSTLLFPLRQVGHIQRRNSSFSLFVKFTQDRWWGREHKSHSLERRLLFITLHIPHGTVRMYSSRVIGPCIIVAFPPNSRSNRRVGAQTAFSMFRRPAPSRDVRVARCDVMRRDVGWRCCAAWVDTDMAGIYCIQSIVKSMIGYPQSLVPKQIIFFDSQTH